MTVISDDGFEVEVDYESLNFRWIPFNRKDEVIQLPSLHDQRLPTGPAAAEQTLIDELGLHRSQIICTTIANPLSYRCVLGETAPGLHKLSRDPAPAEIATLAENTDFMFMQFLESQCQRTPTTPRTPKDVTLPRPIYSSSSSERALPIATSSNPGSSAGPQERTENASAAFAPAPGVYISPLQNSDQKSSKLQSERTTELVRN
jgi:hypothetical protein